MVKMPQIVKMDLLPNGRAADGVNFPGMDYESAALTVELRARGDSKVRREEQAAPPFIVLTPGPETLSS